MNSRLLSPPLSLPGTPQVRSARLAEGALPAGGYDGAGLRADRRNNVFRVRFCPGQRVRREDGDHLQALLGAVIRSGVSPYEHVGTIAVELFWPKFLFKMAGGLPSHKIVRVFALVFAIFIFCCC